MAGIDVRFDGVVALDGVSLTVRANQIVGVIGPNGAGKTTLFNAISRFVTPVAGTITYHGQSLLGLPTWRLAHLGIARTLRHLTGEPRLRDGSRPPGVVVLGAVWGVGPFRSHLTCSGGDHPLIVVEVEPVAVEEDGAGSEHSGERVVEADQLLESEPVQRRGRNRGVIRPGRGQRSHPVSAKVGVDELQLLPTPERAATDGEEDRVGVDRHDARPGDAIKHARAQGSGTTPEVQHTRLGSSECRHRVDHGGEPFLTVRDVALLLRVPSCQPVRVVSGDVLGAHFRGYVYHITVERPKGVAA